MHSDLWIRVRAGAAVAAAVLGLSTLAAAGLANGPRFRPDDPIAVDNDRAIDVGELKEKDDSDIYYMIEHTFIRPGSKDDIPAVNINTIDEVPDSSWFTNRWRDGLPAPEVVGRGPDTLSSFDITGWPISEGKGEGATPGFRVRGPDGEDYQIKFDPLDNLELTTAAEVIGNGFYHAFGYHVVEMYLVEFDPAKAKILPDAKISVQGGKERPLTERDIDAVLAVSGRHPNGRYRGVLRKYPPNGDVIGSFRYYGTRSDDPNDIFPHEHRRELRANKVFAAWINHDDTRGVNSKDILINEGGRRYVKHHMYDFNSTLGSGNQIVQKYWGGYERRVETDRALKRLLTLGLWEKPWAKIDYPYAPPSVGRFESEMFDPLEWTPEYPVPAFERMRPEDAFWAARIVARFDEPSVRAIVGRGRYTDPRAADYIVRTLMERREKVLRAWLTIVMPLVDPSLGAAGFTFRNAAVDAGVAEQPPEYQVTWYAFDNATGGHRRVGEAMRVRPGDAAALPAELANQPFVMAAVWADNANPNWRKPTRVYFRKQGSGWKLVGLERHHTALPTQ